MVRDPQPQVQGDVQCPAPNRAADIQLPAARQGKVHFRVRHVSAHGARGVAGGQHPTQRAVPKNADKNRLANPQGRAQQACRRQGAAQRRRRGRRGTVPASGLLHRGRRHRRHGAHGAVFSDRSNPVILHGTASNCGNEETRKRVTALHYPLPAPCFLVSSFPWSSRCRLSVVRCVTTTSSQPRRTRTDAGGVVISLLTPSVVVMRSTASPSGYFRPCVVTPPALSDNGIRETRSPRRPEMGVCASARNSSTRPCRIRARFCCPATWINSPMFARV